MILTDARTYIAESALNSSVDALDAERIDRGIQFGLGYFIEETRCTRTVDTVPWVNGSNAIDVPATITNEFQPSKVERVTVDNADRDPVAVVDFDEMLRLIRDEGGTGTPEYIGWESEADGRVYPQPDAAGNLKITHVPALISFTAGTGSPGSVTLNVPERWIRPALAFLCATYVHFGAAGSYLEREGWRHGLAWIETVKGQTVGGNIEVELDLEAVQ